MARLELKIPSDEKLEIQASAAEHGLSVALYLRALALQDRELTERAKLTAKMYPEKVVSTY